MVERITVDVRRGERPLHVPNPSGKTRPKLFRGGRAIRHHQPHPAGHRHHCPGGENPPHRHDRGRDG